MKVIKFTFNPIQENTYLIYDETNEAIVIDAGCYFDKEKEALKNCIEEKDLQLKRVINTHLHFDHHFGNKFLFETYGIAPEANQLDEFLLDGFNMQTKAFGFENAGEPQKLGRYIENNETISFGNTQLIAKLAPGHSPGSLIFYNEKEGVVFAGDVLFRHSIGRTDLPGGDYATLIRSIQEKLIPLPDFTIVYSGHGDDTTMGEEKRNNPFL